MQFLVRVIIVPLQARHRICNSNLTPVYYFKHTRNMYCVGWSLNFQISCLFFPSHCVQTITITITLCSVYIPPNLSLSLAQLKNIADQLPTQCIIMGHSALWGSKTSNDKGNILENFSPSRDCVSLKTVLIHTCIYILGMGLILLLLIHLFF